MKKLLHVLVILLALVLSVPALAHEGMDHHATSPTDSFTPALNPSYPVGTQAVVNADHMPGMKGAVATISGAFDTILYAINYTRADTGEPVEDHRWVIHEEIADHGTEPYKPGDTVTLLPGHISGMGGEGVHAQIVQALPGVAYMVDFIPLDGSEPVTNHQWVSEDELLPFITVPGSVG